MAKVQASARADKGHVSAKVVHLAGHVREDGAVSARCYRKPHPIPASATWTFSRAAATCEKCLAAVKRP